jgi:hypothetical protein
MIPKKGEYLASGCCTGALAEELYSERYLPHALFSEAARPWLTVSYYSLTGGLVLSLLRRLWVPGDSRRSLLPLLAAALAALPLGGAFLTEIAAPRLLHMPSHQCAYDLILTFPGTIVGVALYFLGTFAVGWACVARLLGRHVETRLLLKAKVRALLSLSALSYIGALTIITIELALA